MIPVLSRAQMRAFDRYAIETVPRPRRRPHGERRPRRRRRALRDDRARARAAARRRRAPPIGSAARVRGDASDAERRAAPPRADAARAERRTIVPGAPRPDARAARDVSARRPRRRRLRRRQQRRRRLRRGAPPPRPRRRGRGLPGRLDPRRSWATARINHDAYIDLGGAFTELPAGADLAPLEAALAQRRLRRRRDLRHGPRPADRGPPRRRHRASSTGARAAASRSTCPRASTPTAARRSAPPSQADDTVTFGHLKIGLLTPEGARLAGNVHVVDLGVPDPPILAARRPRRRGHPHARRSARTFAPREASVHKHEAGDVLVDRRLGGQARRRAPAARAAMRAGAGLVTVCTWPDAATALESRVVEVMTAAHRIRPASRRRSTARSRGGARSRSARASASTSGARVAVDHVVLGWDGLKVVDADAITHFVGPPRGAREARAAAHPDAAPRRARAAARPQRAGHRAGPLRRGARGRGADAARSSC